MANYKATKGSIRGLVKHGSRSIIRNGKVTPIKSNIMLSSSFKYGVVKVPKIRNGLSPMVICNAKITSLKRTNTIRSGVPAFNLTTFTRVSPRKRPWDGINRRNTL